MKFRNLILGAALIAGVVANAHDFTATVNGQRLYFDITNKTKKTVAVTYKGNIADKNPCEVAGTIEIPAKVRHNNVVYDVTAIGQKAFANADRLKSVVIPSGVKMIGDFAFEDCDSLRNVVFPANPVTLGQGIFFKCTNISDVSLGSDWKYVDFTMFRWSDHLAYINIPARIEKIQGLKKLTALKTITVDSNNTKFKADSGMLYSKDGSTLYACPRAYEGGVTIAPGTVKVFDGALIDCKGVTSIDVPASVRSISFRETSRMKGLETIILRAEKPLITGYYNGEGKFFFQLANPFAKLIVLSSAKDKYMAALATDAGEYSDSEDSIPYLVAQSELPTYKSFKGVKNFDKY